MARNTEFSGKVLEKLTEQRSSSDLHANDVKKLLEDKLTGEMSCSAEQIELIKSIIHQTIAEERKMNESMSDVMLKSLLNLCASQTEKSLESHTVLLDMVSLPDACVIRFHSHKFSIYLHCRYLLNAI